jgi:hypothetical protein
LGEFREKIPDPNYNVLTLGDDGGINCIPMRSEEFEKRYGIRVRQNRLTGPVKEVRFATQYSQFKVEYVGFSDEAQTAFQKAVEIWAANISSPVEIRILATWEALGEKVLGQAGSNFIYLDQSSPNQSEWAWYPDALADKLSGEDQSPGDPDIEATFNSEFEDWYFGTDQNPPFEKYDFTSVVLHEITHGLGFTSTMKVEEGVGSWGIISQMEPYPKKYDTFLTDSDLNEILSYENDSAELAAILTSNDLFNRGVEAVLANNNRPVRIFSPVEFSQGSSVAHLDEFLFTEDDPDSLMSPTLFNGEVQHDPGPVVRGIFRDMGWDTIETIHFAQFAAGGGWSSDVVIQNPSFVHPLQGRIQIYDTEGTPVDSSLVFPNLPSDGSFSLESLGSITVESNSSGSAVFGTVTVTADRPITGIVRFTFPGTGVAGVGASPVSGEVMVPVRKTNTLSSGVAIRNVQDEELNLTLILLDEQGFAVDEDLGMIDTTISPDGQLSKFISGSDGFFEDYFTSNPGDFKGTMVISTEAGKVAAVDVEFESGAKITTLPVTEIPQILYWVKEN